HLSNKSGNNQGYTTAISLETGKRLGLGHGWSLIPQVQMVYTNANFVDFNDTAGNHVQIGNGNSLQGLAGLRVENQSNLAQPGQAPRRLQVYGITNLTYQMLAPTSINETSAIVPTTTLTQGRQALWGDVGTGVTYAWKQWSLYGEADYATALSARTGRNYALTGSAGLRYIW
ncbi:MAG: autotransporter outer membrane beta-barrel domain-containing protein, partial [Acidocella sp.]|nr:autotransporter outer membrane beta-barrel domain-containing protein [Acidocella sp.]